MGEVTPIFFPAAPESQKAPIRDLGSQLDAHRKERRALNQDAPQGAREDLTEDERRIHEQGLIGVLKEMHDELDAVVADAYGWDAGRPEETILQRLVDLNAERRAEEEEGHVRYVRPDRAIAREEVVLGWAPSTRRPRRWRRRRRWAWT
ncbi:hypothetical protein [Salinibacter sp.]|uniref:hypothetical protein n=1 Tax=Salinibacter sp. TaxID=2065818 RepID=UPI0021E81408|nr:hypothetical protein [Salinibacter sp.]